VSVHSRSPNLHLRCLITGRIRTIHAILGFWLFIVPTITTLLDHSSMLCLLKIENRHHFESQAMPNTKRQFIFRCVACCFITCISAYLDSGCNKSKTRGKYTSRQYSTTARIRQSMTYCVVDVSLILENTGIVELNLRLRVFTLLGPLLACTLVYKYVAPRITIWGCIAVRAVTECALYITATFTRDTTSKLQPASPSSSTLYPSSTCILWQTHYPLP